MGRANKCFSSPERSNWFWVSISLLFNGYKAPSNDAKWPASEADHSSLPGSEVKNEWSYAPTPPYAFMACTGKTLMEVKKATGAWFGAISRHYVPETENRHEKILRIVDDLVEIRNRNLTITSYKCYSLSHALRATSLLLRMSR